MSPSEEAMQHNAYNVHTILNNDSDSEISMDSERKVDNENINSNYNKTKIYKRNRGKTLRSMFESFRS